MTGSAKDYFLALSMARPGLLMYHVFVSYRGKDAEAARALTTGLQSQNLRAWWDMDPGELDQAPRMAGDVRGELIPGGDEAVESELVAAIAGSMVVAVITSAHTQASVWVRREIEIARQLQTPLFFWHLVEADASEKLLPSSESVAFMQELHAQPGLNVVGHLTSPVSDVSRVSNELNVLVELGELVLHSGESMTIDSLQRFWPEYESLREKAAGLQATIYERFGRAVDARRVPVGHAFRLKRPFLHRRVRHLERLLEDADFRRQEFAS